MYYAAYAGSETNERFFDFLDTGEATNTNNPSERLTMPFDGRLIKTVVRCTGTPGLSILRIYAAVDGEEKPNAPTGTPLATNEQVGVTVDTANTGFTFSTTGSQHFSACQTIGISFDADDGSSGVGEMNAVFVFEFDMRGQAH